MQIVLTWKTIPTHKLRQRKEGEDGEVMNFADADGV